MAFTGAEKVKIRVYMGSTALYDDDTRLESAMKSLDTDTEDYVRDDILVRLAAIESQLVEHESQYVAGDIDELKVDVVRGAAVLRGEGRRWAKRLANVLGFPNVRSDSFSHSSSGDWHTPYPRLP